MTQAVVGALRVNLGLDSAQYQEGLKNASRQARRFEGEVRGATGGANAFNRALQGNSFRQVSLQLSQLVQQAQAGGGALRALAIQLPDIGLAFGTAGIAAGIVGGVLLSTASAFFDAGARADEFQDTLSSVGQVTTDVEQALNLLRLNTEDLAATYGLAASRVREFGLAIAQVQINQSASRLNELAFSLNEVTGAFQAVLRDTRENVFASVGLREALGVTQEQLIGIAEAFRDIEQADNAETRQQALENVLQTLKDSNVELARLPEELQAAVREMLLLSNEADRAAESIRQLSAETRNVSIGVPLFLQDFEGDELLPPRSRSRSGRGAGGRAASATRRLTEEQKELERSVRATLAAIKQAEQSEFRVFESRINSVSDSIADAIVNFRDFGETVANILRNVASQILSSGISNLLISSLGGAFFGVPGFATGTNYAPGGLALVGERGPELVNLPRGSKVTPNHKLPEGGGGMVQVVQNFNIAANGDESVRRIVRAETPRMAEAAKSAVLDAKRRGGTYGGAF